MWGKISPQGAERKSKRGSQIKSLKNVMYSLEKLIKKKKKGKLEVFSQVKSLKNVMYSLEKLIKKKKKGKLEVY